MNSNIVPSVSISYWSWATKDFGKFHREAHFWWTRSENFLSPPWVGKKESFWLELSGLDLSSNNPVCQEILLWCNEVKEIVKNIGSLLISIFLCLGRLQLKRKYCCTLREKRRLKEEKSYQNLCRTNWRTAIYRLSHKETKKKNLFWMTCEWWALVLLEKCWRSREYGFLLQKSWNL